MDLGSIEFRTWYSYSFEEIFPIYLGSMDLETENRLAALLMDEARRLRREAEKEGVSAYLRQPNVRGRPNARFLTATVLGVQQANRVVEVNEMWKAREKEMELDRKRRHNSADTITDRFGSNCHPSSHEKKGHSSSSSRSRVAEDCSTEDGLKDEELENFLHSKAKRGRGAVGSRMDEPGPYPANKLPNHDEDMNDDVRIREQWESRVLGPEKPSCLRSSDGSLEDRVFRSRDNKERDTKKRRRDDKCSKKKSKRKKEKKHRRHDGSP